MQEYNFYELRAREQELALISMFFLIYFFSTFVRQSRIINVKNERDEVADNIHIPNIMHIR